MFSAIKDLTGAGAKADESNPMYGSEFFKRIGQGAKRASDMWRPLNIRTIVPTSRVHMGGCMVGKRVFVFGGVASGRTSALWILDLNTMKWAETAQPGHVPPPRSGHTLVAVGTQLFLFGGEGDPLTRRVNTKRKPTVSHKHKVKTVSNRVDYKDSWVLDTDTLQWTALEVKEAAQALKPGEAAPIDGLQLPGSQIPQVPTARRGHSACYVGHEDGGGRSGEIWVYGGSGPDRNSGVESCFADLFVLDLATNRWRGVAVAGLGQARLHKRSGHSATFLPAAKGGGAGAAIGPRIVLVGGEGEEAPPPAQVVDLRSLTVADLPLGAPNPLPRPTLTRELPCNPGADPGWIADHIALPNPSRPGQIYIFGGRRVDSSAQGDQPGPVLRSLNTVGAIVERKVRKRLPRRLRKGGDADLEAVQGFSGVPRWELVKVDGAEPCARCAHLAVPVMEIGMLMLGGLSTESNSRYVAPDNFFLQWSYLTIEPKELVDEEEIKLPPVRFPALPGVRSLGDTVTARQVYGSVLPGEQEALQRRLDARPNEPLLHLRARHDAFKEKVRTQLGAVGAAPESWLARKMRLKHVEAMQALQAQEDKAAAPPTEEEIAHAEMVQHGMVGAGLSMGAASKAGQKMLRLQLARTGRSGAEGGGRTYRKARLPASSTAGDPAAIVVAMAQSRTMPVPTPLPDNGIRIRLSGRDEMTRRILVANAKALDAEHAHIRALRWDPARMVHFPGYTERRDDGGGGDAAGGGEGQAKTTTTTTTTTAATAANKKKKSKKKNKHGKVGQVRLKRQQEGRTTMPRLPSGRPTEYREFNQSLMDSPYEGDCRLSAVASGL